VVNGGPGKFIDQFSNMVAYRMSFPKGMECVNFYFQNYFQHYRSLREPIIVNV